MLAVYGSGGFGREVAAAAKFIKGLQNIVFVDDALDAPAKVDGHTVIPFETLLHHYKDAKVVVAIAAGRVRQRVEEKCLTAGLALGTLTARTATGHATAGAGSIICDYSSLTAPQIPIGRSFQCNIYSYVAHDCWIGDYVTFAPRVCCNGNVHIDDHVYVGTGAMIVQGKPSAPLTIGKGAVVGMGSVVTQNVPPYTLVYGSPARHVRDLKEEFGRAAE